VKSRKETRTRSAQRADHNQAQTRLHSPAQQHFILSTSDVSIDGRYPFAISLPSGSRTFLKETADPLYILNSTLGSCNRIWRFSRDLLNFATANLSRALSLPHHFIFLLLPKTLGHATATTTFLFSISGKFASIKFFVLHRAEYTAVAWRSPMMGGINELYVHKIDTDTHSS
jgi:hypothetical protein